jgi:hypothetical protein
MLHTKNIERVRTWPRGVDLPQVYPVGRSEQLRKEWGIEAVSTVPKLKEASNGFENPFEMPLTPPLTPVSVPVDASNNIPVTLKSERLVALFVSRM